MIIIRSHYASAFFLRLNFDCHLVPILTDDPGFDGFVEFL